MMATRVSTPRITGKMQLAIAWAAMAGVALVSTSAPALAHGSSRSGSQSSAEEAAESALLSARDTLRINGVSAPRISPDGRWVLFTQTERDMESEDLGRVSQIWRVRVDGEMRRQLTRAAKGASSPRWFPQGDRIAFRSDRDAGEEPNDQVYVLYTDGGEAWAATDHEGGVQSFSISPDGTKILYTARDPETDEDKRRKKEKDDAVVVDEDFRASHIWVQDLDEASASGKGEPRRLTEGAFTVTDPQWSPDSTRVAYVARYSNNLDDGWNSDIFVADLASGDSRKLFENPGPDASPRWSPDGSTIAFSANRNTSTTTWYNKLYLIPAAGGQPEILLEDFDLNFSTPIWAPGGQDIYWSTGDGTSINLLSVQVATGETLGHVPPAGANSQFQLSPDGGRWVWVHASPSRPGDIVTAPVTDLSQPTRLTDANAWIRNEGLRLADVEVITWTNSEGQAIEGVLHKPAGFTEGVRYPLIVNPHGGPSGAVLTSFNATNQFLSGNGFLVLQPNFRGSSNYGQEFLNANRNYWGVRDYDDIMTGVDYVVGQGWADEDRMVAYGWSYGGYMTFWMSTPDRPLQGHLAGRRAFEPLFHVFDHGHLELSRLVLRHSLGERGDLPPSVTHPSRQERHRQDLDHARRQRRARAPRAGRRVLSGVEGFGQRRHVRLLPAPGARHRRAEAADGPSEALPLHLRRGRRHRADVREGFRGRAGREEGEDDQHG